MKQVPSSDKHNVAWFKLAEFVSRGERERALGIYKLLVHAIEDRAFALQLEGDLLLAFKDEQALQLYSKAASLYEKANRMVQAAAVYEHLIALRPDDSTYRIRVMSVYNSLGILQKENEHRECLCDTLLRQNKVGRVTDLISRLPESENNSLHISCLYQKVVIYLLRQKRHDKKQVISYMHKALDGVVLSGEEQALQRFLSKLQAFNQDIYQDACDYLESSDVQN